MSKLFSLSLYFSSFLPLWISILIIDIKSCLEGNEYLWTEKISIGCIMVAFIISSGVLYLSLRRGKKEGTSPFWLESACEDKTITAEYLLSYILPLFAFDFTQWTEVILFLIFFSTLAFLCIRHNYFSVNVMLELMRYRFYDCKLKNEDDMEVEMKVVSRGRLNGCTGDKVFLRPLNNEYKLDVK